MVNVQTGLESLIEQQIQAIEESVFATRATNALLLARSMKVDITTDAAKVLRHLSLLESNVRSDSDD